MKDPFASKKSSTRKKQIGMERGDFESMTKMRKQQLPEIEESIREALKDYSGENICIITVSEDENGLPNGSSIVMAGVGRMESQVAMAKALHAASNTAIEVLMDGAKGDVKAMIAVAGAVANLIQDEE